MTTTDAMCHSTTTNQYIQNLRSQGHTWAQIANDLNQLCCNAKGKSWTASAVRSRWSRAAGVWSVKSTPGQDTAPAQPG